MKKLSLLVPLVFTAPVQASEVTVGQDLQGGFCCDVWP